jgi:phospholipid/cholesterol/gamma-HCH transport system substrate-binding protein
MKKQQNPFQVAIGFVVLVVSLLFITHIYKIRTLGEVSFAKSIVLKARFSNIDGINTGSDVKISGIKIGTAKSIELNRDDYMAVVLISVDGSIKIPNDSILAVSTSGLLGNKFLDIKPGFSDVYMDNNDTFMSTVSTVNLENLISKFASNIGGDDKKDKKNK